MYRIKRNLRWATVALLLLGILACRTTEVFLAQATLTPTRTPRPTFTPLPLVTDTPEPTVVPTKAATSTPAKTATRTSVPVRPATARPPTAVPQPQPPAAPQPTVSPYEYHANAPTCTHSGLTFIKGTVYLDRNDPNSKYVGAIVALGAPDGATIYQVIKTDDYGEYTFVLGEAGQGIQGYWGLWLVDPSHKRKSDIAGPIHTNGLPPSDPAACWAAGVDFWK